MSKTTIRNNSLLHGLVDLKHDIIFSCSGDTSLSLQLLKPMWSSGGNGFPLVVFIQGSAWTNPNPFWQLPQLSLLARKGYVIASVTHRSCYTAAAPAFLKDVKTALRFLRAHAKEYDINPGRVCAWGTSSGGNTALLMGLTGDDPAYETQEYSDESTRIQLVVDCFGPTDLIKMIDDQYAANPKNQENLLYVLGGGQMDSYADNLRRISPIHLVAAGDQMPPTLILHGDSDDVVLFEDSEALYEKLIETGHDADFVRITDAPHEGSFWSPELLDIIFDFIIRRL